MRVDIGVNRLVILVQTICCYQYDFKDDQDAITLNLSKRGITSLHGNITNCINLEVLYLDGNYLEALPDAIGRLPKLKELNLSNNKLRSLPL